jgi:hypothetical protein
VGAVDEGLPGSQRHQWHRRRLVQGERAWFGRDIMLVDRDVLREGPDPQVAGAGVDLIANLEARTAAPTLVTTPARSWPSTNGIRYFRSRLNSPLRTIVSSRFMPAALA